MASFFQRSPSRANCTGLPLCLVGALLSSALLAEPQDETALQAKQAPDQSALQESNAESKVTLPSYSATYTASKSGISAKLKQTLTPINHNQWRLHNKTSILFFNFEEEAVFSLADNLVKPLTYRYDNSTSSSRSSQLAFDWQKQTVFDQLHSNKPLKLTDRAWDKLSVQAQIRMDLMTQGESFTKQQYQQIDRTKTKTYTVTHLDDEPLNTPLGEFETIKLEERRDGRDKYTLIWLAKNWDYMILRLQRIEDGEVEYQIDLTEATINGKPLKAQQ